MLTGHELLATIKGNKGLSAAALRQACGYDNELAFAQALLEAKGIFFEEDGLRIGRPKNPTRKPRRANGVVKVHYNGSIVLGKPYTRQMSLQPGDRFHVVMGRKYIKLVPHGEPLDGIDDDVAEEADSAPAGAPRLPVTISEEQPDRALVAA